MGFLLLGQDFTAPTFMRQAAVGMKFGNTLKTTVRQEFGIVMQAASTAAVGKDFEVVLPPFAISCTDDALTTPLCENLAFVGVTLFLT